MLLKAVSEWIRVFLRDTLPKKAKLNECGILNLGSLGYVVKKW